MKEKLDKHTTRRIKDLVIYQNTFKEEAQQFNNKVGSLKESGEEIESIGKTLEKDNFNLIVMREDLKNVSMEVDTLIEIYKKTGEDLPKEAKEIVDNMEGYTEPNKLAMYTYIVDSDRLVEREKGLVKTKLDLTKKSDMYKKLKNVK